MSGNIGNRFVQPLQQILDPTGVPYAGAQAFFYATGTSSLQNTYADVALTVLNPNPVLTNSAGFWPNIFMMDSPAYRVVVQDPTGAVIYDCDPCSGVPTTGYSGYVPGAVPIGAIMPFAGPTLPAGWTPCDGAAVSRTVYSLVFAVIGTHYGAGDGATTFNLPDLRGSVVIGKDDMGGVAANRITLGNSGIPGTTIGGAGGTELLQQHVHPLSDPGHVHGDSGHVHGTSPPAVSEPTSGADEYLPGGGLATTFPKIGGGTGNTNTGTANIQVSGTGITVGSFGSGNSQNVQPSLVCMYMIFTG